MKRKKSRQKEELYGRQRKDAKIVPITAVMANAFAEDPDVTSAAGMNAHISKLTDFKILRRTLMESDSLVEERG